MARTHQFMAVANVALRSVAQGFHAWRNFCCSFSAQPKSGLSLSDEPFAASRPCENQPVSAMPTLGHRFICIAFAAALATTAVFLVCFKGAGLSHLFAARQVNSAVISNSGSTEKPFRVERTVGVLRPISPGEMRWLSDCITPPAAEHLTPSFCLHLLHVYGSEKQIQIGNSTRHVPLLTLLLSDEMGKEYFGRSAIARTDNGFRFLPRLPVSGHETREGERHRDQCLATFAELGIPLSREVLIGDDRRQLRGLLEDSVAEFHLRQKEIEWTAIAYALYLPPLRRWNNRYGEAYSFDSLANELLSRRLNEASCCGLHIVDAVTVLYCVDDKMRVLSERTRSSIRGRIGEYVKAALENQESDGSWPANWYRGLTQVSPPAGFSPESTVHNRLLATGHLAEWMLHLPADYCVPDKTLYGAAVWLHKRLKEATSLERAQDFCPYSHAVDVVRQLAITAPKPSTKQSN